jgi:hypothetical protein
MTSSEGRTPSQKQKPFLRVASQEEEQEAQKKLQQREPVSPQVAEREKPQDQEVEAQIEKAQFFELVIAINGHN